MPDDLSDWRKRFSARFSAAIPDGRSLYAYRLTEEEFLSLEQALRKKLGAHSSLGFLARQDLVFPGLFVLYAAEWWRRRYQGKGWKWQPILADLGLKEDAWSAGERGECVDHGLCYWRLEKSKAGGLRYMKSIVLQGGLPMALLGEARGKLGQLLGRVLNLAKAGNHGPEMVRSWIESLATGLPQAYLEEVIYDLLSELVQAILEVVRNARLNSYVDAIARLDEWDTQWRDRFPVPVGDREAQGLIEQLIRDAAVAAVPSPTRLVVSRWLEAGNDGFWTLHSGMELPDKLSRQELGELFSGDDGERFFEGLGRTPTLRLESSDLALSWPLQRLAGHDDFRVTPCPLCALVGETAGGEHRLLLQFADGVSRLAAARRGEALDPELPWLFEETKGQPPRWVRQGGGGTVTPTTIVALAEGWRMEPKGQAELIAYIESPLREIYRVQGQVTISDDKGASWRVRTAQADADDAELHWHGDRVWQGFISPPLGFRGRPTLYDGRRKVSDSAMGWHPANFRWGPVIATWREQGEERHRARLVILPPGSQVHIRPTGPMEGDIRLEGWQVAGAWLTPGQPVNLAVIKASDALILSCSLPDKGLPPECVAVELLWPGNTNPARLRFPFPARGIRAFDDQGRVLNDNAWLPVHRLAGVRLTALGIETAVELRLTLRRPHDPLHDRFQRRHALRRSGERLEIRPLDYAEEIQQLLSADDLLDGWVEATIRANHDRLFTLRISRYFCRMERVGPNLCLAPEGLGRIAPEELAALPVLALRLETPGDEPVQLETRYSEGVPTGSWAFDPERREAGSWFIYPGPGARELFRPTLWTLRGAHPPASPLTQAMAIEGCEERRAALDEVIAAMAADFQEPCWLELERLASHLGHLPLVSFDLWRRVAHSPAGMAALALRLSYLPEGFVERFAQELPFAWELVPYRTWREAAGRLRRQCLGIFGEILAGKEMATILDEKFGRLREASPAMAKLLGLLRSTALGERCKEVELMRNPASEGIFQEQLVAARIRPCKGYYAAMLKMSGPTITTSFVLLRQKG